MKIWKFQLLYLKPKRTIIARIKSSQKQKKQIEIETKNRETKVSTWIAVLFN